MGKEPEGANDSYVKAAFITVVSALQGGEDPKFHGTLPPAGNQRRPLTS